jgi:hypothetical protein
MVCLSDESLSHEWHGQRTACRPAAGGTFLKTCYFFFGLAGLPVQADS